MKMKKVFACAMAAAMAMSTMSFTASADQDEFKMFLAYGGDAADENDWGLQYYDDGAESNAGDVVGTTAKAKVGDTVTIGVTFPEPTVHTWFMAPVVVAEGVGSIDYTIDKVTFDGEDVTSKLDLTVGDKSSWYEATGAYSDKEALRLKGGYNEWAAQALSDSPEGVKEIMYTITINGVNFGEPEEGVKLSEDSYEAFIGFGGDRAEEGDWGFQYYGADVDGITSTKGTLKNGETTTISLEFAEPVITTYFTAPCMIVEDASTISKTSTFDVKVFVDDAEVTTDLTAGPALWQEGTGDYTEAQCVRIGGGYNEWGDKYIAEAPKGFKKIAFEITPNIYTCEKPAGEQVDPVDKDGKYNAYLCFQTPKYSFRNAWDEPKYGKETDFFNVVTAWDENDESYTLPGTFTDAEIAGNGTYTVSVSGLEFPEGEFADQDFMNMIFVSTDVPNSGEIEFSDVTFTVDGKEVELPNGAVINEESKQVVALLIQNIYNSETKEIGFYSTPMKEMAVTFTVSGFNYDKAAEEDTVAPTEEEKESASVEESTSSSTDDSTAAPTEAPATEKAEGGNGINMLLICGIIAAVVVIGAGVGVVVVKKKK